MVGKRVTHEKSRAEGHEASIRDMPTMALYGVTRQMSTEERKRFLFWALLSFFVAIVPLSRPQAVVSQTASEPLKPRQEPLGRYWPQNIILVHGYLDSRVYPDAGSHVGNESDFWYWKGVWSNSKYAPDWHDGALTRYGGDEDLISYARIAGIEPPRIIAANWDGKSKIEDSVGALTKILDKYCKIQSCDLVGHSTGDVLIGYALDKNQQAATHWKINAVFVAGGAGNGTERAKGSVFFGSKDPVVRQLFPEEARKLYNHNMRGVYQEVPNFRIVGYGTYKDLENRSYIPGYGVTVGIDYPSSDLLYPDGETDGLVPISSQGGLSQTYSVWRSCPALRRCDGVLVDRFNGATLRSDKIPPPRIGLYEGYWILPFINANHSDEIGYIPRMIFNAKGGAGLKIEAKIGSEWREYANTDEVGPDVGRLTGLSVRVTNQEPRRGKFGLMYHLKSPRNLQYRGGSDGTRVEAPNLDRGISSIEFFLNGEDAWRYIVRYQCEFELNSTQREWGPEITTDDNKACYKLNNDNSHAVITRVQVRVDARIEAKK